MSDAYAEMKERLEGIARPPEERASLLLSPHPSAKFTNAGAQAIYDALKDDLVTVAEVADELGVCLSTIYNIWRGKTYKDVVREHG